MNKFSAWCTVMGILGFIIGIAYCFTIIFIPVAVYCFLGAKRYMEWAALTDSQLASQKQSVSNWAIFFSIIGFPIGLLSIIPAYFINSNNVTITDIKVEQTTNENNEEKTEETVKEEVKNETSDLETLEKLNSLKKEGLITEEEFNRAKAEVLEKSKKN